MRSLSNLFRLASGTAACFLALGLVTTASGGDFHIDAVNGDDTLGDGSPAAPWRTLRHAVTAVGFGSPCLEPGTAEAIDLWLAPGVYDAALGESFPISLPLCASLHGDPFGGTILRTAGTRALYAAGFEDRGYCGRFQHLRFEGGGGAGDEAAIEFDGCSSAEVLDSRIAGFRKGIVIAAVGFDSLYNPRLTHSIERNRIVAGEVGVELTVLGNQLRFPGMTERGRIANNVIVDSGVGIRLAAACRMCEPMTVVAVASSILNNTIVRSTGDGISLVGDPASVGATTVPAIVGNVIAESGGYAIDDADPLAGDPTLIAANDLWRNAFGPWARGLGAAPDNLALDPAFVDAASGDFHLLDASPCVDAGREAGVLEDLEGTPRPLDGNGDSSARTDIGAFEHAAVASRVELRRADFIDRVLPDKASAFPFGASNPRTPSIVPGFVSGGIDPTPGILAESLIPLAFYQVTTAPGVVLHPTKDVANGTIRFTSR